MIPIRRRVLKLWLACSLLALPLSADQIGLQWNGGTGNWSNPANWNPSALPQNTADTTYALTIPGLSTVNLDITATVDALSLISPSARLNMETGRTLTLGALNNLGTIDINQSAQLKTNSINNQGTINVNDGGSLVLANSAGLTLQNGTLNLGGDVGAGQLQFKDGGAGATFNLHFGLVSLSDNPGNLL